MSSIFDKYRDLKGKAVLHLKDADVEVKLTLEDKLDFVKIYNILKKEESNNDFKGESAYPQLFNFIVGIFERSYPTEDKEVIKEIVKQRSSELCDEIIIAFGLLTREQVNKVNEGREKLFDKMFEEQGQEPEVKKNVT